MASTMNEKGFINQKLFLIYYLTMHWKDVKWSYEGVAEEEGDFHVGNSHFESKTYVTGSADDRAYQKGTKPPQDIVKAIHQLLVGSSSKEKFIVTNKKVIDPKSIDGKQWLHFNNHGYHIRDIWDMDDIKLTFKKNKKNYTFLPEHLDNIKVITFPTDNSEQATLEQFIFNNAGTSIEEELMEKFSDTDVNPRDVRSYYDNANNAMLNFIGKKINKDSSEVNPVRLCYFFIVSMENKYSINSVSSDDDFNRHTEAMKYIEGQTFLGIATEEIKRKLKELKFNDSEIEVFMEQSSKIKKYTKILGRE